MKKEPGYVYIFTNPSFREDWIKIGMSSRPALERLKELDNTSVPLPFEVYATLRTVKYETAERHVHKLIDRLTDLRIRKNREFFNIHPTTALDIFRDVAEMLDDAIIEIYEDNKVVSTIKFFEEEDPAHTFYIESKERYCKAVAIFDEYSQKLTVKAGSIAALCEVESMAGKEARHKRLEDWTIKTAEGYRLKADVQFDSPSGAAIFIMGRSANGWVEWKDENGNRLEMLRKRS